MPTPNHLNSDVAAAIRAEMLARGKTVTGLAAALGISRAEAQLRRDGVVELTLDDVDAVARWLQIERSLLLDPSRRGLSR